MMLPFIGVGQIGLIKSDTIYCYPIDTLFDATHWYIENPPDTIPCYLLVSDTSMQSKSVTYQVADVLGHYMMIDGTPTATKTELVYFRDIQPKVIEGYVLQGGFFYIDGMYRDEKKKPLNKNYIVWQVIEK